MPTTIGRIPPSDFNKGIKGRIPSSDFNKGIKVELSPHNTSSKCWAYKSSLPHDVPLGNNLMHLKTVSTSTTLGASENKVVYTEGGGMYRCLSPKNFMVSSSYEATPYDPNTLTAAVKCPSTP
ncbi:hypothetical protein L195_g049886 [Trifolium pratense]|uniref:Uncharacterized protein n=1 Tax=Trifolium pratense TaxID=57577 RepID=A0A2K3JQZ5_TRIPR|nr:hypothetical protein L195_g049886 [Trifolium pratense]